MYYVGWLIILAVSVYFFKDIRNINATGKTIKKYIGLTILEVVGLSLVWPEIIKLFIMAPSTVS